MAGAIDVTGSALGAYQATSSAAEAVSARGELDGGAGGNHEAGDESCVAALLRDPSSRRRDGYPNGSGTPGPREHRDDADLLARIGKARAVSAHAAGERCCVR